MYRHGLFCVVALGLLCPGAWAMDAFGPATDLTAAGQASVDAEYSLTRLHLDAEDIDAVDVTDDTLKDFDVDRAGVRLALGMGSRSEIFVRFGVAEADPDREENRDNLMGYVGQSDQSPSVGGGARWTLYADELLRWDLLAQVSWANFDFDGRSFEIEGHDVTLSSEIELIETQIATGPTLQLTKDIAVYGGPFVLLVDGEAEFDGTVDALSAHLETDIEQDKMLGAYLGVQIGFAQRARARVEYQTLGGSHALAVGVGVRF